MRRLKGYVAGNMLGILIFNLVAIDLAQAQASGDSSQETQQQLEATLEQLSTQSSELDSPQAADPGLRPIPVDPNSLNPRFDLNPIPEERVPEEMEGTDEKEKEGEEEQSSGDRSFPFESNLADLNSSELNPSEFNLSEFNLENLSEEADEEKFRRYRLGPGDSLLILVQRFPDLTFQGAVNPEGSIVMPLIGTLPLEGLTLAEAQDMIRDKLDRFIVDPDVTLTLIAQRPVRVTVIGEIVRPGFYPLAATRVADALLSAGGSLATADLRAVQVRRTLMDGSVIEQQVDLYTPLIEGQPMPTLRLEDGDVVVVPALEQLQDPNYDRDLISTSTLVKPTLTIRVLSYAAGAGGTLVLPSGSSFRDALNGIPLTTARINSIALIRYDPETGQPVKQILNGRKALLGDPDHDVPLQDNDVVVVGRNLITNITFALSRLTQPFRDVLGFLLFFDSLADSANNLFRPSGN